MATILNATRLTKIYDKKKAVDNIDINVNAGSLVAFLGPNGAGKSTT
ncbi:ATP-binding cassette domain-containing protein, partial [Oenococcus oeni]